MSLSSIVVVANAMRLGALVWKIELSAGEPHRTYSPTAVDGCRTMSYLAFLMPIAILIGLAGLAAFMWTLRSGQYDDLDGAAERILMDDDRE